MQNLKNSKQRDAILRYLCSVTTHPDAEEIYIAVKRDIPNISLGTVYRNLNLLVQRGEILRLSLDEGFDRYDGNPAPHYHFKCTQCRKVIDISTPYINELNDIAASTGKVISHSVIFTGICRACCK